MKKVDLYNGNIHYSIIMNRIKYLCGPNYNLKFELMNIIRQVLNRVESSENQIEQNKEVKVLIDDSSLKKNTVLFEVNQHYDLTTDLKLQSKSIIAKYYETYLNKNDCYDTLYTINCLFNSFSSEINNALEIVDTSFSELTNKQLLKLIIPSILKDDFKCNIYDFNYEELIIFQLRLISYIAENNPIQDYFVIVDIPIMTDKIQQHLIHSKNAITFVLIDHPTKANDIVNYCLCYSNIIDLADEQFIFENIFEQLPIHLELKEVYILMKLIIEKQYNERTKYIIELIR